MKSVALLLSVLLSLVMLAAPASAAGSPRPLDPLHATFSYWDHHWFIWLPRDPEFEAAEIHAQDAGPGGKPLVWVYFTQRALPKTQTNYASNAAFATAKHWLYRDIDYTVSGKPGEPRGVSAKFTDDRGRAVSITMGFDPGTPLTKDGAGVTDQMGHGAENAFLLLYRAASGRAQHSSVSIDGVDVSAPVPGKPDPAPFHAAYSPDTVNAAFLFGSYTTGANGSAGEELIADSAGRTQIYRLHSGSHVLSVSFNPPLPAMGSSSTQTSAFSITVDNLGPLESGSVAVQATSSGAVLDWHPDTPDWTRTYPFQTSLSETPDGQIMQKSHTLR